MNIVFNNDILDKFFDCQLDVQEIRNTTEANAQENPDVTSFNAHKIILANSSKFFQKLFERENKQCYTVQISFSVQTFKKFIDSVYGRVKWSHNTIEEYIEAFLLCTCFELPDTDLHKLIFDVIEYVEDQYWTQKNSKACKVFYDFMREHDVLQPEKRDNLLKRISYIIGKWLVPNLVGKYSVTISKRQDGKYFDFDEEHFRYNNCVINTDCVEQGTHDSYGRKIQKNLLPYDKIEDSIFRISSWPYSATAKTDWQKFKECEKSKEPKLNATVYLDIINGFDVPLRFNVTSPKGEDKLVFPHGLVHYGSQRVNYLFDQLRIMSDNDLSIYANTIYRFVVVFDQVESVIDL